MSVDFFLPLKVSLTGGVVNIIKNVEIIRLNISDFWYCFKCSSESSNIIFLKTRIYDGITFTFFNNFVNYSVSLFSSQIPKSTPH